MRVSLVFAPEPRVVHEMDVDLAPGAAAHTLIAISDWAEPITALLRQGASLSIWGRKVSGDSVLVEGDRLEICRVLRVDPKVARRERFAGQGARGAGLFSQRRPGSKAGY